MNETPEWERLLDEIHAIADEQETDIVLLDGYGEAIIGYGSISGEGHTRVIYSVTKIIEILKRDGMNEDEAVEFFEFNILGLGGLGPGSPMLCEQ